MAPATCFFALLVLGITLSLTLVACGDGRGFSQDVTGQQIAIAVDKSGMRWDQPVYHARAGDVSFIVTNTSSAPHQFSVEGNGVIARSPHFKGGTTNTYTLHGLPAGDYQLVCDYPGHRRAGMIARLIVE